MLRPFLVKILKLKNAVRKEDEDDEIIAHEILLWLKQAAFLNLEKPMNRIHKERP